MPVRRRLATAGLLCGALALTLGACSGEAGPVDDGSYSSLQAGAPAVLGELGVALVSPDQPVLADPNDVVAVLASRRLEAETYAVRDVDGLALDPEKVAGLFAMAGNLESPAGKDGRFVVLSFTGPEAALVFAESDSEIFDDADLEADRSAYFSGNLVAYYAPEQTNDATDRFRAALDALAGL